MQIEFVGELNWSIQLPVRSEGYVLLGLYLLLVMLVILGQHHSVPVINPTTMVDLWRPGPADGGVEQCGVVAFHGAGFSAGP